MANYSKIKHWDIANGKGIRTSIFFTGCEFNCPNCFNKDIQNFNAGSLFTLDTYREISKSMNDHVSGISILGGEPLHPKNIETVYSLCTLFKTDFPNKTIWLWTGSTWEELMYRKSDLTKDILGKIDVLIDGRFIENQKNIDLMWRGSANQRVIDVKQSLLSKKIILYVE